ncbi:MAG: hypothetical protein WAO98_01290 [Alphaproteobacteria bacterium]
MSQTTYDCKVTIAQPEEVGEILAFYQQHRTHAVYLRNEEDIRHSVANELFAITRNNDGQIIAASGVYILGNGQNIECIGNGRSAHGVVAELGSVLRWPEGLPEGQRYPGIWHPFLFSVPMILLAQKVGKGPDQIPVDFLVADVQTTERSTLKRLMGQVDLTPLNWTIVDHPGAGLVESFKKTVSDQETNRDNDKFFLIGDIGNLPEVAAYLRKCIKAGFLTNRYGDKLRIDMSDLVEKWTDNPTRKAGEQRITVLDRIVSNGNTLSRFENMAWCELPRIFDHDATRRGEPLKVPAAANSDYHGSSPVTLIAEAGSAVTGSSPASSTGPVAPARAQAAGGAGAQARLAAS